jgi:hypothetical protein
MAYTFRSVKGSKLSVAEGDENTRMARDGDRLQVPKASGNGLRIGPDTDLTFGWHDLPPVGGLQVYGEPGDATRAIYRGGIKALQFTEGDSAYADFHIPHDYVLGSNIYIHAHWSHNVTNVTGGSTTWGFELMYAKGHNQAAFSEPLIVTVAQNANIIQYQHMVAEGLASTPGGSGVLLNTTDLEVDGLIQCRVFLDSNDLTVSAGGVPEPFVHTVDIHYQSSNVGTKQRAPNFYV